MAKKGKVIAPHWREFARADRDAFNQPVEQPIVYHFDDAGNYDAYVQPSSFHPDLWEVWVGRPGRLVDDKVASQKEAMELAEQILGGEQ